MSSDSRQIIFDRIRTALAPRKERAARPDFDLMSTVSGPRSNGSDLLSTFERNLSAVHGRLFTDIGQLAAFLQGNGHVRGYCDPALFALCAPALSAAGLEVSDTFDRANFESYAFGITRGTAAIAESGTLVIDDFRTSDRLAALAPWVHIAVLTESEILPSIASAVQVLGDSPNIIWCTGPSKTADVEGILIEGVHGPGEQIVLILPSL